MKKRYRFLIILAVLAVGFYFVWPSIKWYFLTAQADKDMAESSRNQIKVYAQERADSAIKSLVAMNAADPLPADYSFLVDQGQGALQDRRARPLPSSWTVQNVLQAYTSRTDITTDCRGVVPRPDVRAEGPEEPDNAARPGPPGRDVRHHPGGLRRLSSRPNKTSLNASQRKDKMAQTLEVLRNKIDQFGLSDPPSARRETTGSSSRFPARRIPRTSAASSWARARSPSTSWTKTRWPR